MESGRESSDRNPNDKQRDLIVRRRRAIFIHPRRLPKNIGQRQPNMQLNWRWRRRWVVLMTKSAAEVTLRSRTHIRKGYLYSFSSLYGRFPSQNSLPTSEVLCSDPTLSILRATPPPHVMVKPTYRRESQRLSQNMNFLQAFQATDNHYGTELWNGTSKGSSLGEESRGEIVNEINFVTEWSVRWHDSGRDYLWME